MYVCKILMNTYVGDCFLLETFRRSKVSWAPPAIAGGGLDSRLVLLALDERLLSAKQGAPRKAEQI